MDNQANDDSRYRPVLDVGSQRIARVYAEALLSAAVKHDQANAVLDELRTLVEQVFQADPRLEAFFSSLAVGREHRAQVIRATLGGRATDVFLNGLLVLNEHHRLDLLRGVFVEYQRLLEERKGQMHALVRSALPLPDDQRDSLAASLRHMFNREPILDLEVDPELLGGLVVRVGDWLYDASVRTQLHNIRNQLFESASHEIQSRRDRFSSAS